MLEACSGTDVQIVLFNLSESAQERVTTYMPNGLALNMAGGQTGDQDPAAAQHVVNGAKGGSKVCGEALGVSWVVVGGATHIADLSGQCKYSNDCCGN